MTAVIGEFKPAPGTAAEYELGTDLTRIFADPPAGLVLHYGAITDGLLFSGSVWIDRQSPLDFFSERAGEGLTEFIHRVMAPGRDPDLTYQLMPALAAVVGPAAEAFVMRPRGQARGAVLVRTPDGVLPPRETPGLIFAAKLSDEDDGLLYEFFDREPAEPTEAATCVTLHSLFTAPSGLEKIVAD